MAGFYDKIIPDFLNKFGKKWGAKVEDIEIETGVEEGDAEKDLTLTDRDTVMRTVHSLPITEEMKESALTEGFPLFKAARGWERVEPELMTRPAERELNAISALVNRMVGSHVVFPDTLTVDLNDPETQKGLKKHGWTDEEIRTYLDAGYTLHSVAGSMTPVLVDPGEWRGLIRVAVGGKNAAQVRSVAFHEAFETARRLMLTPEEIKILDAKFPGRKGKSASEIQADIFGDYWTEKKGVLIPKSARTLFDKISAFFERIKNYLDGLGFQTAEDIFAKARPRRAPAAPGARARIAGTGTARPTSPRT